jgi:hypothetical protein
LEIAFTVFNVLFFTPFLQFFLKIVFFFFEIINFGFFVFVFLVLQGLNQRPKTKIPVVGTASLNLAEFASVVDQKDFDLSIPLTLPGGSSAEPSLSLTVCSTTLSIIYCLYMPPIYTKMFIFVTSNKLSI